MAGGNTQRLGNILHPWRDSKPPKYPVFIDPLEHCVWIQSPDVPSNLNGSVTEGTAPTKIHSNGFKV